MLYGQILKECIFIEKNKIKENGEITFKWDFQDIT